MMVRTCSGSVLLLFLALTAAVACAGEADTDAGRKIPAFPGAEGFGAYSVGGRGGAIHIVTNLDDGGPGSLRAAVEARGPRIVVFRLSGTIDLESALKIREPYITIAGQTAPGDGICLKNYPLLIEADHVIVRYIRGRPGAGSGKEVDAMGVYSGRDIIIDHCSTSWSVDETLSVTCTRTKGSRVTVQWCLITESLNRSVHRKGSHGYGSLIRGGWGTGYTFHHNLYAHHSGRSPRPGNYASHREDVEGLVFDFRNNVIYNWGGRHAGYNADGRNGADSVTRMNFVGNYYKAGPNSKGTYAFSETCKYAQAYFKGNCVDGVYPENPWSLVDFRVGRPTEAFAESEMAAYKRSIPVPAEPVKTDDAVTAYERVLAHVGASLPNRDAVDSRIVAEVRNGTGHVIDAVDEVGGWP